LWRRNYRFVRNLEAHSVNVFFLHYHFGYHFLAERRAFDRAASGEGRSMPSWSISSMSFDRILKKTSLSALACKTAYLNWLP